jgi:hypothetical protein
MRPSRSFNEVVKIANFFFNEGEGEGEGKSEDSDWVCASAWLISVIACSNSEALFFVRCVFVSFSIYTPFFICLIGSVCEVNLSVCFNRDVFFRFFELAVSLMFILFVN